MKQSHQSMDDLGLYLSIPFCRAKCTFCNFASDAFAPGRLPAYVDRLCAEIAASRSVATGRGTPLPQRIDSIYLGGGTPSLLSPGDVRRLFTALRDQFALAADPEITVECAPGQLIPTTLEEFQRQGVNRLSFGVQSFVDRECAAIGRLHTAGQCLAEIDRVRAAGLSNLSIDLIAGLPHQTKVSWLQSIDQAIQTGVPHTSIYMLELDEESRLGREVLGQGTRYGASAVPSDDETAAFYELACDRLESAGVAQYEISNFARPGLRSRHNLKYWQRKPYLGFGLDAHSMLRTSARDIRFANTDDLDTYLNAAPPQFSAPADRSLRLFTPTQPPPAHPLTRDQVFEEKLFLGLRMTEGVRISDLRQEFGGLVDLMAPAMVEAAAEGLIVLDPRTIRLTARGRLLSNEVFSRFLLPTAA